MCGTVLDMDTSDPEFKELVSRAIADEDARITCETAAVFGIDSTKAKERRIDVHSESGDHTVVLMSGEDERRYLIPATLINIAQRRKLLPIRRKTKLVVEDGRAHLDYDD